MSNRQARREQSRTARTTKPQRANKPAPGRPTRGSGGNGPDFLSRPFLFAVSGVIVILAIILGIMVSKGGGSGDKATIVANLQQAATEIPVELANGVKLGKDDAPIKLDIYEDFQCPFCLKYTADQEPTLINEYVKTGKVQMQFHNLPLIGKESVPAATASLCAADQNKFWEYSNKLFLVQAEAGQATTERKDVGRFSDSNLKKYASELGLDQTKFESCMANPGDKTDQLLQTQRTASGLGIDGTPGFVINGQRLGTGTPATLDGWRQILDSTLNTTPAAGSPSPAGTGSAASPSAAASGATAAATSPAASATATR